MSAKQTPLVDLLRLHAEDLHSDHGYNKSARLLSQAADEITRLRAELAEMGLEQDRLKQYEIACVVLTEEADGLRAELAECKRLLRRYRTETVLGHQPHMIAHEVDAALAANGE